MSRKSNNRTEYLYRTFWNKGTPKEGKVIGRYSLSHLFGHGLSYTINTYCPTCETLVVCYCYL